jgi:hypothetical protein
MPTDAAVPPALERVVRRCLEKDPEERFQSVVDVAFALEAVETSTVDVVAEAPASRPRARRGLRSFAAALAGAGLLAAGLYVGRETARSAPPTFRPLTFRRGWMAQARFAPDGRTVLFSAAWDGGPVELYQSRTDNTETRSLGLPQAFLCSVSTRGEMAFVFSRDGVATLATAPIGGTTPPRELLTDVYEADWLPDGKGLLIARRQAGETTLELPPGNVIHRRRHAFYLRVSPDGRYAVFRDGPDLVLFDIASHTARTLVSGIGPVQWGLAWAPSSREVWFTEGSRFAKDVVAVDLEGRWRLVYRSAADLALTDISADGRALLHRGVCRDSVTTSMAPAREAGDLSVAGMSLFAVLSADGRSLLTSEGGSAGVPGTYLRADGAEPVRLADGDPLDVSPDGRAALVLQGRDVAWVPVGPGLPRTLQTGLGQPAGASFVPPDASRVLVWGRERDGEPLRVVLTPTAGGAPRAVANESPELSHLDGPLAVSPDGRFAAGRLEDATIVAIPLDGGKVRRLGSVPARYRITRWTGDGRALFLARRGAACQLARLDLASGRFEVVREVTPRDPVGVGECRDLTASADGSAYAAVHTRCLTDLVLAEGLR